MGLAKPSAGSGTVFGLDVVRDSTRIRQRIGYLAQDPLFFNDMTARETLRFTASLFYQGPRLAVEARIAEVLELVGLSDKADRPIRGFSGGERQRLGIAQAQINYPDLLILDEPAASLDPMGRHDVLAVMEQLRKHTTIFYSTHILEDVQRVSDTVAILNKGELVAQAPIDQLLAGNGGVVYDITLTGNTDAARSTLANQSWVAAVTVEHQNGKSMWHVSVTDAATAEAQLLAIYRVADSVASKVTPAAPAKALMLAVRFVIVPVPPAGYVTSISTNIALGSCARSCCYPVADME